MIETDEAAGSPSSRLFDFADLEAHPAVEPRLLHQGLEVLGEVDRRDELTVGVEEAAGLGQEDDLEGLEREGELARGDVGVDVDDLPARSLAEAGDDWKLAGADARKDRVEVDLLDHADVAELVEVEEPGLEHAGGDGARARAEVLERLDELQVLALEDLARDLEDGRGGDAEAVDLGRRNVGLTERDVELRAGAVDDDWAKPDALEERERRGERVELLREDVAADLDDRELLRVDRGVLLQILLDLLPAPEVSEEADDDVLGRADGGGRLGVAHGRSKILA